MKANVIHPRPNQIAELTKGVNLPTEPLGEMQLRVITEKVNDAWEDLRSTHKETLEVGAESEINSLLQSRLNAMIGEDELWGQLVRCVVRGGESLSFDGSHLEKRPDLSLVLTRAQPAFPLVVECKLIDSQANKTVRLYCNEGLRRFVIGDYAWANREALMLAYVRDKSTVAGLLFPYLTGKLSKEPDPFRTVELPAWPSWPGLPDCGFSVHHREFVYVGTSDAPGDISMLHIWLMAT
jgi:hypothetical protein